MTPMEQIGWWLCIAAGLAGSFVCSGLETGVYTLNRVTLEVRSGRRLRAALLLRHELDNPERLLATLLISNNVFAYLVALGATALLSGWGYSEGAIVLITVLVLTPVIFVFTESVPKELFRSQSDRLTYALSNVLWVFRVTLTFVLVLPLVRWAGLRIARLLGAGPEVSLGTGRDRVAALLKESAGYGLLSESQTSLVDRAMVFARTTVGAEMVPWTRIRPVRIDRDRMRVLRLMHAEEHSSYPVVDRQGEVVGVLSRLEFLCRPEARPADVLRPPVYLAPSTSAREALLRLGEARCSLGIVGSRERPIGIVTIRDLVEPLTGDLPAW